MLQLFTLSTFSEWQEKVGQESPNFSQVIQYIYLHIHFMYQYAGFLGNQCDVIEQIALSTLNISLFFDI